MPPSRALTRRNKTRRWLLVTFLAVGCVVLSCKARSSPTDSQRLDKFLKQVAEANPVPIVIGVLGQDSGNMALTTYEPTRTFIQIKDGLETDLRQNVEVHELFHIQLQHEGYPSKYPGSGNPSQDDPPRMILDCISHPMIDSRMRAAGWKPDLLLRSIVDTYKHQQLPGDIHNVAYQAGIGLDLYCLSVRVGSEDMAQVNERFVGIQPNFVMVEQKLRNQFGDLSCSDPDACFQLAKRLRDAVFTPSVLLINPKTGTPE
jgi:hypothetical protein